MSGREVCPHCGEHALIEDEEEGEALCPRCGYVAEYRRMDRGPEWRSYGPSEKSRERVGAPLTYLIHDMGLSTVAAESSDGSGGVSRIQRRNIVESGDKSLIRTLSMIHGLSLKMGLPDSVEESAALIVRRAVKAGLKIGRSFSGIAAASLFISCRIFSIPKTMKEFAAIAGVSRRTLWNSYKNLKNAVKLGREDTDLHVHVSRIVNRLGLRGDVEREAVEILEAARKAGLTDGRRPEGVAAAAVYVSSRRLGQRVSQRRLAKAASVTLVTLRRRYKEMLRVLESPSI